MFFFFLCHSSNSNVPHDVLQSLKKQCNPTLKKTFKERNPDVDMDEIQNNPNVPEDVKAAISGALSLALEEEEFEESDIPNVEGNGMVESIEAFDDDYIMDISDDDLKLKKNRRRRIDENDEDWRAGYKKPSKPKRSKKKKKKNKEKKRTKSTSENDVKPNGEQIDGEIKIKKKRPRKSNELNGSVNSTNTTIDSSFISIENGNPSGSEQLEMIKIEPIDAGDAIKKEIKQKKTPKKRDKPEKPMNGIVKKTQSRRQFTSIKAIMECIESVVRAHDVSIDETATTTVKLEIENPAIMYPSDMYSPMKTTEIKTEFTPTSNENTNNIPIMDAKPKHRRKSSSSSSSGNRKSKTKVKPKPELLQMGKVNDSVLESVSMNSLVADTTVKNPRFNSMPHNRISTY